MSSKERNKSIDRTLSEHDSTGIGAFKFQDHSLGTKQTNKDELLPSRKKDALTKVEQVDSSSDGGPKE